MAQDWTINYLPSEGGRITGKLIVGNDDVRFEALYDSSNKTILKTSDYPSVRSLRAAGTRCTWPMRAPTL